MKTVDLKLEELDVPVSVRHPLHHLDLVVRAFQGTRGDPVVIPGQDTPTMGGQQGGELDQHRDAGHLGAPAPVRQELPGLPLQRGMQETT